MSISAKEGWLKDKDGNYLSPKTLIDQVKFPEDGSSIRGKIEGAVQGSDVADSVSTAIAGGASVVPSGLVINEINQKINDGFLFRFKLLSGAIDFNAVASTGAYWCNISTASSNNYPTSRNGVLLVFNPVDIMSGYSDGITQMYMDRTDNKTYRRSYINGTWSSWVTL